MSCPYCGDESRQFFLGNLGSNAIIRCGMCGWQYNDDRFEDEDEDYVVSRSEAGHFTNNGDTDMLVYRDVAENAVEFFNSRPSGDYESVQLSIIKNGELAREIGMIRPDVILRCICRYVSKFDGVVTVLSYRDMDSTGADYNDLILSKVEDVRIGGGYLAISGTDRKGVSKTFRYRICDPGAAVRPVVPTPVPKPPVPKPTAKPKTAPTPKSAKKRITQDTAISRVAANSIIRYFEGSDPSNNFELPLYLAISDDRIRGYQYTGMTSYFFHRDNEKVVREDGLVVKYIQIAGDYLVISYKESPMMPDAFLIRDDYLLIRDELDHYAGETPTPKVKPVEKPAPKPTAKPKAAPAPKPKKKKTPTEAPKSAKNGVTYEVRVNGTIRASYSSKAKAEAEKKKLKAAGEPAKIFVVGY